MKDEKWVMPEWMRKYFSPAFTRYPRTGLEISSRSAESVEVILNDKDKRVGAAIWWHIKGMVDTLERLHDRGQLNDSPPDLNAEVADIMIEVAGRIRHRGVI